MRIILTLAFSVAVAACGSSSKPAPTSKPAPAPAPTTGELCGVQSSNGVPTNAEQCECLGYTVVGDIGNGQVECADGATEVARIQYGIEGGVCCKPAGMPVEPVQTLE